MSSGARAGGTRRPVQVALENVKNPIGQVPVCAWCKKIRNDTTGSWQQLEDYIVQHTEAQLSHGICPECFARQSSKRG